MKTFFILLMLGIRIQGFAALPPEAEEEQLRLRELEAAAEAYPSHFIRNVNTDAQLLSRLDVIENVKVNGQAVLSLPEEVVPVLDRFHGIVFQTQGGPFEVFWQNGGRIEPLTVWWGGGSGKFAVRVPDRRRYSGGFDLLVKGSGVIELVGLYNPDGISLEFDEEPWGIPASDEPVRNVRIRLDATTRFSIGGVSDFDRKKYMRIYGLADGPPDFQKAAEYFTSKGWTVSRGAGKNLLEWSTKTEPVPWLMKSLRQLYPDPPGEVLCFSEWPETMAPSDPLLPGGTGTPAVDRFDEAAELAATVVRNRGLVLGEYAGPWCEVKNESDIAANWSYFSAGRKYDAWKLLADFHNQVADAVKRENPGWKVGGPSSCMPSLDRDGFRRGEEILTFMDRTREHLDYYSLHFYERDNFRLQQPAQHGHTYLFGRLEGILDTFRNKMHLQNDVKPILITEYGGSRSPGTDIGYWKFIRSSSALMMRFMQHPDCLEMSVPFVIPVAFYSKNTEHPLDDSFQLFIYDDNRRMQLTNLHYFLDFWSDFQGHRIVSETDAGGVTVNALRNGKVIYLAVNNLSLQRISVDVQGLFGSAKPEKAEQIRLYIEEGRMVFRTEELPDLKNIPLAFDETSIIKIHLDREPAETGGIDRRIFFSDQIMQPTGGETEFAVQCPVESLTGGKIRISLGRDNGFRSDLTVSVNGETWTSVSLEQTRRQGMYYGTVEVPVEASALRPENRIRIRLPDRGGKIASVVLVNNYREDTAK
jgi:agarase